MKILNQYTITLNYFISKFYLENNLNQAQKMEDLLNTFNLAFEGAQTTKLALSKSRFSTFILALKDSVKLFDNPTDRRLMRSLISFAFITRREGNKNKNYLDIFNLSINNLPKDSEFNTAKLISEKKKLILKFPRK